MVRFGSRLRFRNKLFGGIHMIKHEQTAEPPSCLFMVGQDSHGNWAVQNQSRTCGGLFGDLIDALRFVRSENENRTQAYTAVSRILELDMVRATSALQRQPVFNSQRDRMVA